MAIRPGEAEEPQPDRILAEDRRGRNAAGLVLACLALLVVAGALLRARDLAARPLWLDEASFWKSSLAPLMDKLAWRHHHEHPPFGYIVEGWVLSGLGDRPEWIVRLPSFLFGIACIPLAFVLGRAIGGNAMGLLAATLATFDPVTVEQSRQARMYTQFEALLLVTLWATIELARRRSVSRILWMGLGVLQASLYWTSQAALAVWAGEILGLAWTLRPSRREPAEFVRARRAGWAWTWWTALVLASPGLYRLLYRLRHPILSADEGTDVTHLARDMISTIGGAFGGYWGLLLLPIAVVGLIRLSRMKPAEARVLTAIAVANVAGLVLLRSVHAFLTSRYLVALLPSIWVGASAFVVFGPAAWRRRAQIVFAMGVVGCAVSDWVTMRPSQFQVGAEIRALAPAVGPGDAVVFLPRYLDSIGEYYGVPPAPPVPPRAGVPEPADLDGRRVWVVAGNLIGEHRVRQARDWVTAITRRRGGDGRLALDRIRIGYIGVMVLETDGRLRAFEPEGARPRADRAW